MNKNNFFQINSSESVGKGHPDKICDLIADCILDECLKNDPQAKVACEVMASNRLILIGGELTTSTYVDVIQAAWQILLDLGYNENDFTIISNINKQSSNIAQSVFKTPLEFGAGDQGIVYGYATNETANFLPLSYVLATELIKQATQLVQTKELKWAKYDMKSLVSISYQNSHPVLSSVIFSIQHDEQVLNSQIHNDIYQLVFKPILEDKYHLNSNYEKLINTSDKFIVGGPIADTGLTNRKLMVDSYGGLGLHGGGGFSGKDPTKVDRSGAYFARWIAKNLVAAKICEWVEVKVVFALGLIEPVNISLRCNANCLYTHDQLVDVIKKSFPLKLKDIIKELNLQKPQYFQLACYGHFGRDELDCAWEKTNKIETLKNHLKKYNVK